MGVEVASLRRRNELLSSTDELLSDFAEHVHDVTGGKPLRGIVVVLPVVGEPQPTILTPGALPREETLALLRKAVKILEEG